MSLDTVLSIIGIILALVSFFVSPDWIKSTINKTILSSRQKRIDSLKEDYDTRKFCREHRDTLTAALIASVSSALYHLAILVFWVGTYTVTLIRNPQQSIIVSFNSYMTFFFLFTALNKFNSTTRLFNETMKLDEFKQETVKKLKKLGLSAEEATELLDKEETKE